MNYKYNDYELLYLIRENEEIALEIMFKKYHPLICSKIKKFNVKEKYMDDFYQEGLICLYKAIITYDMNSRKSFNKYVDLVISRRYINLLTGENKHFYSLQYVSDFDMVSEDKINEENINDLYEEIKDDLSEFEKNLYKLFYNYNLRPKNIADVFGYDIKKIYNGIFRIKEKIKESKNNNSLT